MIRIRRIAAHNFKQLQSIDLTLPSRGRVLVQGLNEAGKSTLFEAIFFALFGQPLATEAPGGKLDDLIRYDLEEALVEVELALPGERALRILRRVRRDKPNVWELEIARPDGTVEEVRANRPVNERIEAELGFDGEALLNTCFVEQKKLEKLEGMTLAQRETSLMKLLNLDRLSELGDRLKIKPADRAQLARLRDRALFARLQAEYPQAEARFAEVVRDLDRIEVHAALGRAMADLDVLAGVAADLAGARVREADLAERAAAAERLAAGLVLWQQGQTAHEQAREAQAAAARLDAGLAAAVEARDVRLPAATSRGQALRRLKRRLGVLDGLAADRQALADRMGARDAELTRLAEARAALNTVRHRLVEARADAREAHDAIQGLEQDLRAFDVRAALAEWATVLEARHRLGGPSDVLESTRLEREAAERELRRRVMRPAIAVGLFSAIVLGQFGRSGLLPVLGFATSTLAAAAWLVRSSWRKIQELTLTIGRLEGEASVAEREAERLAALEAAAVGRLNALNAVRPADLERAAEALAELDRRLGDRPRADVEAALHLARERVARAAVAAESLEASEAELRASAGQVDGEALGVERDAWEARSERIVALLARRRPGAVALAASLGVDADASSIDGEIGGLRADYRALSERAGRVPELERDRLEKAALVERHLAAARAAWLALPVLDARRGWSDALAPDDWATAGSALRTAYEAAGGDAVRRALEAAAREAAELAGRHASARQALTATVRGLDHRLTGLGVGATSLADLDLGADAEIEPTRRALAAVQAAVQPGAAVDAAALSAERDRLRARIDVVRHEIGRLERELGLAGEVIDPEHAEVEHRDAAHALAVRERAAAIVEHAGRNVVRRILPSTLLHMQRLLPMVTQGRYFLAQLTDDYRIEVYDERAATWKKKNIFSGGTRDQLSLVLRLAFALATLPEERGAAPGFLFLDEPLGAFDDERARALIDLLTEGEVAESFDQIFLISHVRVDPALFDYHVTLAGGRVVESDLPA